MLRRLGYVGLVAAVVAAVGGGAYAAIPSSSGVISACKGPDGTLRAIDAEAGQMCPGPKQLLEWNQQGPPGPVGPPGPTGPAGPSDGYVESVPYSIIPPDGVATTVATLSLPAGKYVLLAKGHFSFDQASGRCMLNGPQGGTLDTAWAYKSTTGPALENFSLIGGADYAIAGEATVSCLSYGGFDVHLAKLSAIKVANLTAPAVWAVGETEPPPWKVDEPDRPVWEHDTGSP